ncbi:MAG: methyltransferase [Alphaproteobacteria bacterium]|nr:methyltransferase [Alphaproteobacteria bacterium]
MSDGAEFAELPLRPAPGGIGGLLELPEPRRPRARVARPDLQHVVPPPAPAADDTARTGRREDDPTRLERMLDDMVGTALASFSAFAAQFDFSRHRRFADIGGATAQLSCLVAERHPHLSCRSYDHPRVRPIAERRILARRLGGRVRAESIDIHADEFAPADVVAMGLLLMDWNPQRKRMLLAKAHRALAPGGAMVAIECADAGRGRRPASGAQVSSGRVIVYGDAFDLSGPDFARWCGEAGFARREVLALTPGTNAIIAYK